MDRDQGASRKLRLSSRLSKCNPPMHGFEDTMQDAFERGLLAVPSDEAHPLRHDWRRPRCVHRGRPSHGGPPGRFSMVLVARCALSSTPDKAIDQCRIELGLPEDSQLMASWQDMLRPAKPSFAGGLIASQCRRHCDTQSMSIMLRPMAALEAGFHVICDKPLTCTNGPGRRTW